MFSFIVQTAQKTIELDHRIFVVLKRKARKKMRISLLHEFIGDINEIYLRNHNCTRILTCNLSHGVIYETFRKLQVQCGRSAQITRC